MGINYFKYPGIHDIGLPSTSSVQITYNRSNNIDAMFLKVRMKRGEQDQANLPKSRSLVVESCGLFFTACQKPIAITQNTKHKK